MKAKDAAVDGQNGEGLLNLVRPLLDLQYPADTFSETRSRAVAHLNTRRNCEIVTPRLPRKQQPLEAQPRRVPTKPFLDGDQHSCFRSAFGDELRPVLLAGVEQL
jgi:hypothetical protein